MPVLGHGPMERKRDVQWNMGLGCSCNHLIQLHGSYDFTAGRDLEVACFSSVASKYAY